jgi:hypothetical protein
MAKLIKYLYKLRLKLLYFDFRHLELLRHLKLQLRRRTTTGMWCLQDAVATTADSLQIALLNKSRQDGRDRR